MATVQQIAKELNKSGYKKAGFMRSNFQNIPFGHYEARHLRVFGLNCITVTPKNGVNITEIVSVLSNYNTEIKNGIIIIK